MNFLPVVSKLGCVLKLTLDPFSSFLGGARGFLNKSSPPVYIKKKNKKKNGIMGKLLNYFLPRHRWISQVDKAQINLREY